MQAEGKGTANSPGTLLGQPMGGGGGDVMASPPAPWWGDPPIAHPMTSPSPSSIPMDGTSGAMLRDRGWLCDTHACSQQKGEDPQARHPPAAKARLRGHFWGANSSKAPSCLQTLWFCGASLLTGPAASLHQTGITSPSWAGAGTKLAPGVGVFNPNSEHPRSAPGWEYGVSRQWSH